MKVKEIREEMKKYKYESRYREIFRWISAYPTRLFLNFDPNFITLLMILVGLVSLIFFSLGGYWNVLIGCLILQLHFILDMVDGNIAKIMNKKSIRGRYLDYISNITVNPLIWITLGIGLFRTTGNFFYLLLGVSAGFFYLAVQPARVYRYELLYGLEKKSKNQQVDKKLSRLNLLAFFISDFPHIINIILLFAIFNLVPYLMFFYGGFYPLYFLARVAYEFYTWKSYDLRKK